MIPIVYYLACKVDKSLWAFIIANDMKEPRLQCWKQDVSRSSERKKDVTIVYLCKKSFSDFVNLSRFIEMACQ